MSEHRQRGWTRLEPSSQVPALAEECGPRVGGLTADKKWTEGGAKQRTHQTNFETHQSHAMFPLSPSKTAWFSVIPGLHLVTRPDLHQKYIRHEYNKLVELTVNVMWQDVARRCFHVANLGSLALRFTRLYSMQSDDSALQKAEAVGLRLATWPVRSRCW